MGVFFITTNEENIKIRFLKNKTINCNLISMSIIKHILKCVWKYNGQKILEEKEARMIALLVCRKLIKL